MYEAVLFYSDLSSDFMLVPHTFINLTGEKNHHMQKDLKGRSPAAMLESEQTWGRMVYHLRQKANL